MLKKDTSCHIFAEYQLLFNKKQKITDIFIYVLVRVFKFREREDQFIWNKSAKCWEKKKKTTQADKIFKQTKENITGALVEEKREL